MPEGYCVKCKAKKEIAEAVEETMKNGRKAIKGKCPTCGVVMFKILGGKAAVPRPTGGGPAAFRKATTSPPEFSMAQQLAYVIITPYTLHKSRTGGILARLITRTGLELAAARMFAPSAELVQQYSDVIISTADPQDRRIQELIRDYILRNLAPDPKTKRPRRAMVLLFRGEEAVRKVRSVVGNISAERRGGETIRDTYGDLILDEHDQVRYFEPAVLAAPTPDEAVAKLKLVGQLFGQRRRHRR
jgi:nucleoside diphosphate kinase